MFKFLFFSAANIGFNLRSFKGFHGVYMTPLLNYSSHFSIFGPRPPIVSISVTDISWFFSISVRDISFLFLDALASLGVTLSVSEWAIEWVSHSFSKSHMLQSASVRKQSLEIGFRISEKFQNFANGHFGALFSGPILPFWKVVTSFSKKVPPTILASILTHQNQANAHLNLDNSSLNKCPKIILARV